jgi:uncharacterized membrane protein YbhN (UPF0104 family)
MESSTPESEAPPARGRAINRRWLVQSLLLVAGLAGIAFVIARSFDEADEQVLPSAPALIVAGVLTIGALAGSARSWVALFSDLVSDHGARLALRGTFYLSQLTKYLPAGGVVQTASQLGLARTVGIPLKRSAVAFPVSVVGVAVACATLGSGLALDSDLAGWVRLAALAGPLSIVLLHQRLMAKVLDLAHRLHHRIPGSDQLPTQRDILALYGWALVAVAGLSAAYAVLLSSLDAGASPFFVFCAFALSWLVGFLVVPLPAGVGVREAVLVGLLPGVGTAPLLAASLALRLLSIGAELLSVAGNKWLLRRHTRRVPADAAPVLPEAAAGEATTP